MKKTNAEQVLRLLERGHGDAKDLDPFIISGSKVLEGVGTCKHYTTRDPSFTD
jgi:Ca2+-transporting ATPase